MRCQTPRKTNQKEIEKTQQTHWENDSIRELENEKATSFIISPPLGAKYTMGAKSSIS